MLAVVLSAFGAVDHHARSQERTAFASAETSTRSASSTDGHRAGSTARDGAAAMAGATPAGRAPVPSAPEPPAQPGTHSPTPVGDGRSKEQPSRSQRRSSAASGARAQRRALRRRTNRIWLQRGDRDGRGKLVSRVQLRLGITADGRFGQVTADAVRRFQSTHDARGDRTQPGAGLPVTGIVDDRTWRSMRRALSSTGRWLSTEEIAAAVGASPADVAEQWPVIEKALVAAGMSNVGTRIAVLATVVTEVGPRLRPIDEHGGPSYFTRMYEGRGDLGNSRRGDGARYHGRGYIQLTGRANYRTYGQRLGLPLEERPNLALRPRVGGRVLVEYFRQRGIDDAARKGRWRQVRLEVNGGYNGWSTYWSLVRSLLRASMR